jgi:hypothetical protein
MMAPYTSKSEIRQTIYYNEPLRRVRVTTVGSEKQYGLYILSACLRLSNPACIAHAVYYAVICDLSGCTIFFHIIS